MRLWPVLAVLLLTGCAMFDGPVPLRDSATFTVMLVDRLPGAYPGQVGRAVCNASGDNCALMLLRDQYPLCLTHEIRHAFEGPFHGSARSGEDCHVY